MLKELFLDRVDEVKMLSSGLKNGKDFVLIAPRRFGKTALAHKVLNQISKDKNFNCISIDIMRCCGSVQSIAEAIVEQCLKLLGITGKLQLILKQLDLSLTLKLKYNNLEIEPMLQLMKDRSNQYKSLENALELLEQIAHKANKNLIVFFDEFGELNRLGNDTINIFRSVIQLHKNVSYIFAGSQESLMNTIFIDPTGAFYRFGTLIHLKELNYNFMVDYLAKLKWDFSVAQFLLNQFNCHPYYTATIIKDITLDNKIANSIDNFIDYLNQILLPQERAYLELQLVRIRSLSNALDVMNKIAHEITITTNMGTSRQSIYNTLKSLENLGYINQSGKVLKITDPLLAIYLRQS